MIVNVIVYFAIAATCAVLQSGYHILVPVLAVIPAPDLAFLVLVFVSFTMGEMQGQIIGFGSGLIIDFMSLSPFGFNSLVRTVAGHVVGRFKGVIQLDAFLLPMLVVGVAVILKTLLTLLFAFLLGIPTVMQHLLSLPYLLESLFTVILAPAVFWPLKLLLAALSSRKAYRA